MPTRLRLQIALKMRGRKLSISTKHKMVLREKKKRIQNQVLEKHYRIHHNISKINKAKKYTGCHICHPPIIP